MPSVDGAAIASRRQFARRWKALGAAVMGAWLFSAPNSISSAVTPGPFSVFLPAGTLNKPAGIAATASRLLVTDCAASGSPEVLSVDSTGKVFRPAFATLPGTCDDGAGNYIAIAPGPANPQHVAGYPTPNEAGFPSNFVFVTGRTSARASAIFQVGLNGGVSEFTAFSASSCPALTGITFDRVGSFHRRLVAVCSGGQVWLIGPVTRAPGGSASPVTCPSTACQLLATVPTSGNAVPRGPDVAPRTGPLPKLGGSLLLAVGGANGGGTIFAVSPPPSGAVTPLAAASSPESVAVIPRIRCTYASWAALPQSAPVYFAADDGQNTIGFLPLGALAEPAAGNALVAAGAGNGITLLRAANGKIVNLPFASSGSSLRGSAFVDCGTPFLLRTFRSDVTAGPGAHGLVSVWILETASFNPLTICVGHRLTAGGQTCPPLADPADTPPTYGVTGTEASFAGCGSTLVSTAQGLALECKFYSNLLGIRKTARAGGLTAYGTAPAHAGVAQCASIMAPAGGRPSEACGIDKNLMGLQNANYNGRLIIKLFFVGGGGSGGEPGGGGTSGGAETSGSHGPAAAAPAAANSEDNDTGGGSGASGNHGNGQGNGSGQGSGEQGDKGFGHGAGGRDGDDKAGKGGGGDKGGNGGGDKGGHDKGKGGKGGDGYAEGDD